MQKWPFSLVATVKPSVSGGAKPTVATSRPSASVGLFLILLIGGGGGPFPLAPVPAAVQIENQKELDG